jgi:hypothetical protein
LFISAAHLSTIRAAHFVILIQRLEAFVTKLVATFQELRVSKCFHTDGTFQMLPNLFDTFSHNVKLFKKKTYLTFVSINTTEIFL